jgi:hypothetical protein
LKIAAFYFTSSLFFHLRFLLLHFLHFNAVAAFLAPQSLQIFMCNRCFCAMAFLIGSNMGICWPSVSVLRLSLLSVKYTFCLSNCIERLHLSMGIASRSYQKLNSCLSLKKYKQQKNDYSGYQLRKTIMVLVFIMPSTLRIFSMHSFTSTTFIPLMTAIMSYSPVTS